MQTLVRIAVLLDRKFPVSRSTLYADVKSGHFPPPINLGPRSVAWIEEEIDLLVKARMVGMSNTDIHTLVGELIAARSAVDSSEARRSLSKRWGWVQ